MKKFYYVNRGITQTRNGDFLIRIHGVIYKFTANQALFTDLTYTALEFQTQIDLWVKAILAGATTTAQNIEATIRYMFRVCASDVEREVNKTNNSDLAEMMDMEITNTDRVVTKAPIEVLNDVINGDIIVDLLAVTGAYGYILECTQINETGGEDKVTERRVTNAHSQLTGFISGAKYSFRAMPVFANNLMGGYTPSVVLRIN
ncbi:MAG: hypothetical protein WCL51_13265 [Bacteroidota bacterium]